MNARQELDSLLHVFDFNLVLILVDRGLVYFVAIVEIQLAISLELQCLVIFNKYIFFVTECFVYFTHHGRQFHYLTLASTLLRSASGCGLLC